MAIMLKRGDGGRYVWGADPDTRDESAGGVHVGGGWYAADGQPDGCTVIEIRALGASEAMEAAGDPLSAVRLGVVSVDGAPLDPAVVAEWPPLFVRAVAQLVTFASSGLLNMDPTGPR